MANGHRKVRQKKHLTRKQSKTVYINEYVQANLPASPETGEDRESGWVGQPSPVWRQLSPVWKGGQYELLEGGEMDPFSRLASGEGERRSLTPDCEKGNESAHFGQPEVEKKCIHQDCGWNSIWCQKCQTCLIPVVCLRVCSRVCLRFCFRLCLRFRLR